MLAYVFAAAVLTCAQRVEYAQLFGNSSDLGYYYVNVWVGTPAAKQTVIVDTGSRLTAFPCTHCPKCGHHIDKYFNYEASSTSRSISCSEQAHCATCSNDQCGYSMHYAEGSSIEGILVEDVLMIGDDFQHNKAVPMVFGCHTKETNLFRTQLADGIMGLSYSDLRLPTIVEALYGDDDIKTEVFSLCFALDGGFMAVGGYDSSTHLTPIQWMPLYGDHFYGVKLNEIYVNGHQLSLSEHDFGTSYESGTILDSGTTFVYLATPVYSQFWSGFLEYCRTEGHCGTESTHVAGESRECYYYDSNAFPSKDDFFSTFPTFKFGFNNVYIEWIPKNYLTNAFYEKDTYCLGVYSNGNRGSVLGGTFMRGLEVVFNKEEKTVGIASSNCNYAELPSIQAGMKRNNTEDPTSTEAGGNPDSSSNSTFAGTDTGKNLVDQNTEELAVDEFYIEEWQIMLGCVILALLGIGLVLFMYLRCKRRGGHHFRPVELEIQESS